MRNKIRKFENGGNVTGSENIIDPDEVMFGEDGNPLPADDKPDFELQGTGKEKKDEETERKAGEGTEEPGGGEQKDGETGDGGRGEEGTEEKEAYEPINHADYVLKSLGFKTSQIDLGEGRVKDVADLTPEEELDVITARIEELTGFYETKLSEATQEGAGFTNDVEKLLVETLRSNDYNLAELVRVISENDPASLAKNASNEDLVKNHLKSLYPDFTEEELNEELDHMAGSSNFERLASRLRESMAGKTMGESDFAKAIQDYRTAQQTNTLKTYEADVKGVRDYVEGLKEFANIPLNEEVKNFVLQDIIPEDPSRDSKFIEGLNSPDRLFRYNFLDKFHEKIVENTASYYYELGKKEGDKISGRFKDSPDVIMTGNRYKPKARDTKKKDTEEVF